MGVCVSTVTTAFGSSAAAYAYIGPPSHMSSARILAASATITGAASSAASSNITIIHTGSSHSSAEIATGAMADTSADQIVKLTVNDTTAAANAFTSTEIAKISLPALAASNLAPVQIQITWDENAITAA